MDNQENTNQVLIPVITFALIALLITSIVILFSRQSLQDVTVSNPGDVCVKGTPDICEGNVMVRCICFTPPGSTETCNLTLEENSPQCDVPQSCSDISNKGTCSGIPLTGYTIVCLNGSQSNYCCPAGQTASQNDPVCRTPGVQCSAAEELINGTCIAKCTVSENKCASLQHYAQSGNRCARNGVVSYCCASNEELSGGVCRVPSVCPGVTCTSGTLYTASGENQCKCRCTDGSFVNAGNSCPTAGQQVSGQGAGSATDPAADGSNQTDSEQSGGQQSSSGSESTATQTTGSSTTGTTTGNPAEPTCQNDTDCPSKQFCNFTVGACRDKRSNGSQCGNNRQCSSNRCENDVCVSVNSTTTTGGTTTNGTTTATTGSIGGSTNANDDLPGTAIASQGLVIILIGTFVSLVGISLFRKNDY